MVLAGSLRGAYGDDVASESDLELRVSRLENDSDALYELVDEIKATQREHSQHFGKIEATLTEFQSVQTEHSRRFDGIETTLVEVLRRLPDSSRS